MKFSGQHKVQVDNGALFVVVVFKLKHINVIILVQVIKRDATEVKITRLFDSTMLKLIRK